MAYVALGSNLGARAAFLAHARLRLGALPSSRIIAQSGVDETVALTLDGAPQPNYLNQMIAIETDLSPSELLASLREIENGVGRVRTHRWSPRTLDLDIVLFGRQRVHNPDLEIPHPELPNREFWRRQLREIGAAS